MSDRRQQLYDAVLDDPDALEPRLAMAAWLDEQGDPQGEFIRLQIEASKEPLRYGGSPRYGDLTLAADKILAERGKGWATPVEAIAKDPFFHRGFVESVTMSATDFLNKAPELFRLAPIRHLAVNEARDVIETFAASPHLAQLVTLWFLKPPIGDAGVRALAGSPHLKRLKVLKLGFNDVGMEGLEALCETMNLPGLVYVNLAGNRVDSPDEKFGSDWRTGRVVRDGSRLDPFGVQLEQRFGYKAWFHGPSLLTNYPPCEDEF